MKIRFAGMAVLAAILTLAAIACDALAPGPPPPPPEEPGVSPTPCPPTFSDAAGDVTPFSVNLEDENGSGEYEFDPAYMTFCAGETVTFTFTSETEYHTFEVDDLDIFVEVEAEDTQTFTFTFDEPGEYQVVCEPHRWDGMLGTIIVR